MHPIVLKKNLNAASNSKENGGDERLLQTKLTVQQLQERGRKIENSLKDDSKSVVVFQSAKSGKDNVTRQQSVSSSQIAQMKITSKFGGDGALVDNTLVS